MAKLKKKIKKRKTVFSSSRKYRDDFDDFDHDDNEFFLRKDVLKRNYGYNLQDKLTDPTFDLHTNVLLKKMGGDEFTVKYCQETGFVCPIFFEKPEGLGLKMPRDKFGVKNVQKLLGAERVLDVMEVGSQKGLQMTMKKFLNYYKKPPEKRKQLLNVLSLEFSNTKLEKLVQGPKVIKELDWVELAWPKDLRQAQIDGTNAMSSMKYPKVQNYCLMSVGGCYTDFHVDFGGTSVWYHVLKGEKVFWLAPPTDENLQRYQDWTLTGQQQKIFLGDLVEHCIRIHLKSGNTFMIPSGWIHAVYTPVDSMVFGGNFLHCFAVPIQLRVYQLEINTRVPKKFRYPFFYEMQWYLAERYFYAFTGISYLKKLPTPEHQIKQETELTSVPDLTDAEAVRNSDEMITRNEDELAELDPLKPENQRDMVEDDPLTNREDHQETIECPPVLERVEIESQMLHERVVKEDSLLLCSPENLRKLTKFELDGLKSLIKWLNLPESKRHAPDRLRDAELMLLNLKEAIKGANAVDDSFNLEGRTVINPITAKRKLSLDCPEIVEKRRKIVKDKVVSATNINFDRIMTAIKDRPKNDSNSSEFKPKFVSAGYDLVQQQKRSVESLPTTKILNFNSNLFGSTPKVNSSDDLQLPTCSETSHQDALPPSSYVGQQPVHLPSMTIFQRSSSSDIKPPANQYRCVLPLVSIAGQSSSSCTFVDLTPSHFSQQRPPAKSHTTLQQQPAVNYSKNIRTLTTKEINSANAGQTFHKPAILRSAPASHSLNFNNHIRDDSQHIRQIPSSSNLHCQSNLHSAQPIYSMPQHHTVPNQVKPRQTEFVSHPSVSCRPTTISLPVRHVSNLNPAQQSAFFSAKRTTAAPEYRVLLLPTEKAVRPTSAIGSSNIPMSANLYRYPSATSFEPSVNSHQSTTIPSESYLSARKQDFVGPSCTSTFANLRHNHSTMSVDQYETQQSLMTAHQSANISVEHSLADRTEPNIVPACSAETSDGGSSIFSLNEMLHRF